MPRGGAAHFSAERYRCPRSDGYLSPRPLTRDEACHASCRIRTNARLPVLERYADGAYRSELRANWHCRATDQRPIPVRVIEYTLPKVREAELVYRLVTTLLDPATAPAAELAALYHERWEPEGTFDEIKTHLKGAQLVLRSKTPALVRQEVYGLLLAHYAVRGLLHEAALGAPEGPRDPDNALLRARRACRPSNPATLRGPPPLRSSRRCTPPC